MNRLLCQIFLKNSAKTKPFDKESDYEGSLLYFEVNDRSSKRDLNQTGQKRSTNFFIQTTVWAN